MEFEVGKIYDSHWDNSFMVLKQINDILFCLTYSDRHDVFNFTTININEEWLKDFSESDWRDFDSILSDMTDEELTNIR